MIDKINQKKQLTEEDRKRIDYWRKRLLVGE